MKKILLAALAALTLVSTVWAATVIVAPTLRFDQLKFRTHAAAGFAGQAGAVSDFGLFDAVDSTVAMRVGVAGASWPLDTTTAISTDGWAVNDNKLLADSTDFCTFFIYDQGGNTNTTQTGVDSMYIACQGSVDGTLWVTLRTFVGGTISSITDRLDQTNVTGAYRGVLTSNGASLANGGPVWIQRYRLKDTPVAQEPSDAKLDSWPYLRWIFGSHDAGGYKVKCGVSHYAADNR